MILVLNEWIFHDLLCENGPSTFKETADFVVKLEGSDDVLVVPAETRWKRKAYQLMTATAPAQRIVSQKFHRLLRDSRRSIHEPEVENPQTTHSEYSWAPTEDIYLVEAYSSLAADLLVTTDEKLFAAATERADMTCHMRDRFLAEYKPSTS